MSYIGRLLFTGSDWRGSVVIRYLHSGSELRISLGYWTPSEPVPFSELFKLDFGAPQLPETYVTP